VDLFFGMPKSDEQDVHREREHVWKGILSAPRRSARDRHKQLGATQHSNGTIPDCICVLPDFYRCPSAPEYLPTTHTRTHRANRGTRPRIRRAIQQPHHQVPRPYLFTELHRSAVDVRNPRNLPAQYHRGPAPQNAHAGKSTHQHHGNVQVRHARRGRIQLGRPRLHSRFRRLHPRTRRNRFQQDPAHLHGYGVTRVE